MTRRFLMVSLFLLGVAALAAVGVAGDALEVPLGADEASAVRLSSGGNRTGFRVRGGDSEEGNFTSVLLGKICEVDAEGQRVSGRCLRQASDAEEWEWTRSNTTNALGGVTARFASLTVPLQANVPSCVEGGEPVATEADASITLTVFTVFEYVAETLLDGGEIEMMPTGVGLRVAFASWPFCSEGHSLQLSLNVGEETPDARTVGGEDTGRPVKIRDLDDVRAELNKTERMFSERVREGAEAVRGSVLLKASASGSGDHSRARVCSDEAAEQLDRPMANNRTNSSACRSASSEMALIMVELACTSEQLDRQTADEAIACHAPGGPPANSDDGGRGRSGIVSDLQIDSESGRQGGKNNNSSRTAASTAGGDGNEQTTRGGEGSGRTSGGQQAEGDASSRSTQAEGAARGVEDGDCEKSGRDGGREEEATTTDGREQSGRYGGKSSGGCSGSKKRGNGSSGCSSSRGDDSQKRYGLIPGVGRPPKSGGGKLAIIPVAQELDANFLLMDIANADGASAPIQSSVSESGGSTVITLNLPYFEQSMTYEVVSALAVADAAVGQNTAAIANLISTDALAAEMAIASVIETEAVAEPGASGMAPWVVGVCAAAGIAAVVAGVVIVVGVKTEQRRQANKLPSALDDVGVTKTVVVPMTERQASTDVAIMSDSTESV